MLELYSTHTLALPAAVSSRPEGTVACWVEVKVGWRYEVAATAGDSVTHSDVCIPLPIDKIPIIFNNLRGSRI